MFRFFLVYYFILSFRRVLTAAWQQWMLDSDRKLDYDGFVTVDFGEIGHFVAALGSGSNVD